MRGRVVSHCLVHVYGTQVNGFHLQMKMEKLVDSMNICNINVTSAFHRFCISHLELHMHKMLHYGEAPSDLQLYC